MNDVKFLNRLMMLNPALRFSGLVENSRHLNASVIRVGVSEHLKGRNPEISYSQSSYIVDLRKIFENVLGTLNSVIYIYDKVILFSVPIRNHIFVISADRNIDIDTVFKQVQSFIKNSEDDLDFELGIKNINQEKRESQEFMRFRNI